MSTTLKYVRHSVAGFVVWPKNLEALAHRDVGHALRHSRDVGHGEILSAGFVEMKDGKPFCHGRSESMDLDARLEDTAALRAEWGLALPAPAAAVPVEGLSMSAQHTPQASRTGRVEGRLARRVFMPGDALPDAGSLCLVSGAHCDIDSDQHRAYAWRKVIGYSDDDQFICLQTDGCWPTVERTKDCWFAEIPVPRATDAQNSISTQELLYE